MDGAFDSFRVAATCCWLSLDFLANKWQQSRVFEQLHDVYSNCWSDAAADDDDQDEGRLVAALNWPQ